MNSALPPSGARRWEAWNTVLQQPQPPPAPAADAGTPPPPPPPAPSALAQALAFRPPAGWRLAAPLLGALVVGFGLLLVQPPFVTAEPAAPYEARRSCAGRVVGWSAGAALLMYLLPLWGSSPEGRAAC